MKPKWQKLASLAQELCTLYFKFFGAVFASKGYTFKNIFKAKYKSMCYHLYSPMREYSLIWSQSLENSN